MKLGLPPRSIGHGFLEQSRESKRLGHERNEPDKACLEGHLKNTRIPTLREKSISRASDLSKQYKSSIDRPQESTDEPVVLMDLLEIQVEASEQLMIELSSMMMSPIQSRCSSQEVGGILKDEGSELVGPKAYLLLEWNVSHHLTSSFPIGCLRAGVCYDEHDGRPSNRIAFHVAHAD